MKEAELIDALLRRSDGALDQLQLHYGPLIRYVITPILPDPWDRDEIFNDVLLRVWDRIDRFDPQRGDWNTWLTAIARNAAIDRARKGKPAADQLTDSTPAQAADPEQDILRQERQAALRNALGTLTYEEQKLFYRKYYYRQSTAQIAAECGASERAIEGRLYRAKQKLRKQLGGVGFE